MEIFTREDVLKASIKKYGGSVSVDFMDDAMMCETLDEAVEVILIDSCFWDNDGSPPIISSFL